MASSLLALVVRLVRVTVLPFRTRPVETLMGLLACSTQVGQILHRGGMVSFSSNGRTAVLGTALLVLLVAPAIADPVSQSRSSDERRAKKRAGSTKKLMPRSHRAARARAGASDSGKPRGPTIAWSLLDRILKHDTVYA